MLNREESYAFVRDMSAAGRKVLAPHVRWFDATAGQPLIARGDDIGGVYLHIDGDGRENTLYWVDTASPAFSP